MGTLIHHNSNSAKWQHLCTNVCVCRSNSTKCAQNMHFFPPQSHKKVDILFMHWVFIFYKTKIEYIHCWSTECEFIRLPFENWAGIIYFQICFECLQNVEHSKCVDWTHLIKTKMKQANSNHKSIKPETNEHFQISHWIRDNGITVMWFFFFMCAVHICSLPVNSGCVGVLFSKVSFAFAS